ncbi:helix-turn-helix domain-containing protein [Janthinobacterium svalbardensis]|nr:helix-turn-helix transcriptional regulator [Janthinobacterium svalbardensis]
MALFNMAIPDFGSAGALDTENLIILLRDRVRFERRRQKLSQAAFAESCGIPLRTFKRYESTGTGSIELLVKIAQGFGRARGFDSIFPPQPLNPQPRGINAVLARLEKNLEKRKTENL